MRKEDVIKILGADEFDRLEQGEIVTVASEDSNYDERDPAVAERTYRRNGKHIECDTDDGTGYHVVFSDVFP